jgi:pimeloyl-ACP methyl ester carboxylesterase
VSGSAVAAPGRNVPFRGSHLVVHDVGSGPSVGYLHGFLGNPGVHPFLEALAAGGRRVVAPNLPGFTGSPACDELRGLHDWVAAASEAIDLAGLAGRPVVASSIGAMLALEVAAVRPEAFEALVLVAPLGLYDEAEPVGDAFATTFSGQKSVLTADPAKAAAFWDDAPGRSPAELIEDGVARYLTRTASASLVWPIPEFGLASRIHRVTCPVTLVWGSADELDPPGYAARYAAALPNVVGTHVVGGAGHQAEWDEPEAVAAIAAAAIA